MLGRLIPPVAVLGHQLGDDVGQLDGNRGIERADVGRRFFLVLDQLLKDGPARERGDGRSACETACSPANTGRSGRRRRADREPAPG